MTEDTIEAALAEVPSNFTVFLSIFADQTAAVVRGFGAEIAASPLTSFRQMKSAEATAPTTAQAIRDALAAFRER